MVSRRKLTSLCTDLVEDPHEELSVRIIREDEEGQVKCSKVIMSVRL